MRRSFVALLLLAACSGDDCRDGAVGVIRRAHATSPTEVELVLGCDLPGLAASDVTIETFARSPDAGLAVHAVTGAGGARSVTLSTDPQVALLTYTVRIRDAGSANFVGTGDVVTAPVTLRVDDRYDETLGEVHALVTVDDAGVFTYYTSTVELADPDGDHVFELLVPVAVDPRRTVAEHDDRMGPDRLAYAARAIDAQGNPLTPLVTFEVREDAPQAVDLPLLSVPDPPGPEGLVDVTVSVDDTPARALTGPALRVSATQAGEFDATFPTTIPLVDADGDRVFTAALRLRIDPKRQLGGTTSETFPYVLFVANAGVDYPAVGTEVEALDEDPVSATITVGNPALVPVTFRADVSAAYLNATGSLRGLFPGEAPFLTGEFGSAEDAFGQNAADAFTGGENVVLQMIQRDDFPGVWERTLFLPPSRPYGWKVVRCPAGVGCSDLNRHVVSSGRAFATVMKNLATENRDAQADPAVKIVDPRAPLVTLDGGGTLDYAGASVYVGTGTGLEPDPPGTPDGATLFKQELPDLVVDVGTAPVTTPVVVVGTWRDVNLPVSLAEIVAGGDAFDLNPWDYDAGYVGGAPPSYTLPGPPAPPPFDTGDGALDASAVLIPGGGPGSMTLSAALSGTTLYVATQDAGEGSDHFLFVAATAPGTAAPAPWAKAGTVAAPASAVFLADEDESVFAGWFAFDTGELLEAAGADARPDLACGASSGVLEGTVDLASLFGGVPATIYLAAGPWASPDGGALYSGAQMPATVDGNGNLDAGEFAVVDPAFIEVAP